MVATVVRVAVVDPVHQQLPVQVYLGKVLMAAQVQVYGLAQVVVAQRALDKIPLVVVPEQPEVQDILLVFQEL
jgi:hypothetical protein